MLDLESKLTEAAIGVAHLHESKDFSHGRFMLAMRGDRAAAPKIMMLVGEKDPYERLLVRTLKGLGDVAMLTTQTDGPVGALELLIEVQMLVYEIAAAIDPAMDISKPGSKIPRQGLKLYKWRHPKTQSDTP
jgi:hypothetical protein